MDSQTTFVMLKPDCVQRKLVGKVLKRFEKRFRIKAMRLLRLTDVDVQFLYAKFATESFFPALSEFMCSGPVVVLLLEGPDAVYNVRAMVGATSHDPAPGTIRGEFAEDRRRNVVHASDSEEAVLREAGHFFPDTVSAV